MYTSRTGLVLEFHGTDQTIVNNVLNSKQDLQVKKNYKGVFPATITHYLLIFTFLLIFHKSYPLKS